MYSEEGGGMRWLPVRQSRQATATERLPSILVPGHRYGEGRERAGWLYEEAWTSSDPSRELSCVNDEGIQ